MTQPLVSVVIPTTGDRPERFVAAIESVARQTHPEIELLVVDDSISGVAEHVDEAVLDAIGSVEWLQDGNHDGPSGARNTGMRAASGEFIAFLDDDDRWLPEKTARQVRAFEEDTGLVCVGQRSETPAGETTSEYRPTASGDVTEALLRGAALAPTSSAMVRADLVEEHDLYFDERLAYLEDRDLYLEISRHCSVATIAEPLVIRGVGEHAQLGDDFGAIHDTYLGVFARKHRSLAETYGEDCVQAFTASVLQVAAGQALGTGHYPAARRYALRAIRNDPSRRFPYLCLIAAAGGRFTHKPTQHLKRRANHLLS